MKDDKNSKPDISLPIPLRSLLEFCRGNGDRDMRVRCMLNGNIISYVPEWEAMTPQQLSPSPIPYTYPYPFAGYSGVLLDRQTGRIEYLIAAANYRPLSPEMPGTSVLDKMTFERLVKEGYILSSDIVIDLEGRTITPGLIDAHAHLAGWGTILQDIYHRVNHCPIIYSDPKTGTKGIVDELKEWIRLPGQENRPYYPWVIGHGYAGLTVDESGCSLGECLNDISDTNIALQCKSSESPFFRHPKGIVSPLSLPLPVFVYNSTGQMAWFSEHALNFFNDYEYNGGGGRHPIDSIPRGEAIPSGFFPNIPGIGRYMILDGTPEPSIDGWKVKARDVTEGEGAVHYCTPQDSIPRDLYGFETSSPSYSFNDLPTPFFAWITIHPVVHSPFSPPNPPPPPWDVDIFADENSASFSNVWKVVAMGPHPDEPNNPYCKELTIERKFTVNGQVEIINKPYSQFIWYIPLGIPPYINRYEKTELGLPQEYSYNYYKISGTSVVYYKTMPDHHALDYTIFHYPLMRKFDRLFTYFWPSKPGVPHYTEVKGADEGHPDLKTQVLDLRDSEAQKGLAKAVSQYHEYGLTGAHDVLMYREGPSFDQYVGFTNMHMRKRLYYYVESFGVMQDINNRYLANGSDYEKETEWVKVRGWKVAIDGGTMAGSIATQVPFLDPFPGYSDVRYWDAEDKYKVRYDFGIYNATRKRSFGLLVHSLSIPARYNGDLFEPEELHGIDYNTQFVNQMKRGIFDASFALGDYNNNEAQQQIALDVAKWASESRVILAAMFRFARENALLDGPNSKRHQIAVHAGGDLAVGVTVKAIEDSQTGIYWVFDVENNAWRMVYELYSTSPLTPLVKDFDPRFRIEHGNWITKYTIDYMRKFNSEKRIFGSNNCGILVSVQPHIIYGGGLYYRMVMPSASDPWPIPGHYENEKMVSDWEYHHEIWQSRSLYVKPLRALLDAGVPVCMGADPPANSDPHPNIALFAALSRRYLSLNDYGDQTVYESFLDPRNGNADGILDEVFQRYEVERRNIESQWIGIDKILAGYTYGSAYAARDEEEMGLIRGGFHGDFAIWNWNMLEVLNPGLPQEEIANSQSNQTEIGPYQPHRYVDPTFPIISQKKHPIKALYLLPEVPLGDNEQLDIPSTEGHEQLRNDATIVGGRIVFVRSLETPNPQQAPGTSLQDWWNAKVDTHYYYHATLLRR